MLWLRLGLRRSDFVELYASLPGLKIQAWDTRHAGSNLRVWRIPKVEKLERRALVALANRKPNNSTLDAIRAMWVFSTSQSHLYGVMPEAAIGHVAIDSIGAREILLFEIANRLALIIKIVADGGT
jgi:hypothetical protein